MAGSAERDRVKTQPALPPDSVPAAEQGGAGGSATDDYGGMGRDGTNVDPEGAAGVGADPPSGLPLGFGGGTPEDQHDTTSAS